MRLKPAAFIFDMDGVIIDSEPIHSRVKMDTFHHFDLPFDEADLIHYMGRTSDEIFGEVIAKEGRKDLRVEDLVRYKHEHYLEVLQSGTIAPIEGAVELIRQYRRDMSRDVENYLATHDELFNRAFDAMDQALISNDIDGYLTGNAEIQESLGYLPRFRTQQEFDDLMASDDNFVL